MKRPLAKSFSFADIVSIEDYRTWLHLSLVNLLAMGLASVVNSTCLLQRLARNVGWVLLGVLGNHLVVLHLLRV